MNEGIHLDLDTEVSISHVKSFLALSFAYPLFYSHPRDTTQLQDS